MTLYAPTDEALAEWEAHWSAVGDVAPCVGVNVHSMRAPRYFLAPSMPCYNSAPYTVDDVRLFCDRWPDVIRAEALAAETCRRLGWSDAAAREPCMWSVAPSYREHECFRIAQLWDGMRFALYDHERRANPWGDLWARAPTAAAKVDVLRRAWDELAARGQTIRTDHRRREVKPTVDANPFAPLVALYRLGVGFGRDDFGDTHTRLSLSREASR